MSGFAIGAAVADDRTCVSSRPKIVGGSEARLADWPGQAALRINSEKGQVAFYFCGGTAISARWVLTAAHCLPDFRSKLSRSMRNSRGELHEGRLEVVLGSGDLKVVPPEHVFAVEQVVIHERYRASIDEAMKVVDAEQREQALARIPSTMGDDIALLKLERPWSGALAELSLSRSTDPPTPPITQVRVAGFGKTEHNLWKNTLEPIKRLGRRLVVVGTGEADHGDATGEFYAGSDRLLETAVETVPIQQCEARYAGAVMGDGQVCAGLEQGGKDSCQGDSGGPLVAYDKGGCPRQIGVVSWGEGCAEEKAYGIYTRISAYADWIQSHTGPLKGAKPSAEASGAHLSLAQVDEALRQIETLLGKARGKVSIAVKGGNRVKVGDEVIFEARSELTGRLVVLDINASREVTLIYPNQFVSAHEIGSIKAGQRVAIPGPDYPGFTAFRAVEPAGKGQLLALIVPKDFDIERFAAAQPVVTKGFQPVSEPPSYLMRLVRQIEAALTSSARAGGSTGDGLKRWGYAIVEYEIVR
jgi:secreted trypsin-like serine protease